MLTHNKLVTAWRAGHQQASPHVCIRIQPTVCRPARLSSVQLCGQPSDDKSPSQPVLIGGPRGLYKGKEGGDWLCFTENIITPLNAGGPTEFPRPRNGDDHPGWEYMTWLTEALSPIWKPNCEAWNKGEEREMVTVCLVIFLPLALTSPCNTTLSICWIISINSKKHWNKLASSVRALHALTLKPAQRESLPLQPLLRSFLS